jgi:hypothetical protein
VAVDPDAAEHPPELPGPPTPPAAASRPPAVPRPSAGTDPPEPPPARAFVTYLPLPPSTPPVDTSELAESHLPPAGEAAPPPADVAPSPAAAETPALPSSPAPAPPPRRPPAPPRPPKPPREPLSGGLIIAIVVTVVLLLGGGVAALVLGGDEKPKPVTAATAAPADTATPDATRPAPKRAPAGLGRQVQTLDGLMKTSEKGRAAAAKGDTKAAIANRAKLVKDIQRLRTQANDKQLKAGLGSFAAAVRESLRQNRECGAGCPASDLSKVNRLKQDTVGALNPLLRKYAKTTYRARDI